MRITLIPLLALTQSAVFAGTLTGRVVRATDGDTSHSHINAHPDGEAECASDSLYVEETNDLSH